ncbi:MAG: hypothetical protein LUJ25_06795, partial [Firmicutes bacterium]|nr:hypothetical protein [Bacillota bacterium]
TANDVMNTKDKQRVLRHLETAKQKVKKEKSINDNFAKREVMTNINSDIADLLHGKPVDTSHYTKEYFEEQLGATDQAAALYQKVRIAEGAQPHIAALANATRAERAKTMGSLNPTSHDEIEHGIYDAVVAANAQFEKDLAEDPAGIFMGGYNNINLEGDSTLQALHGQAMQDGNWQPYISRFQELARYYGVPTSTSFDNKTALILPDSEITALKNQIFTGLGNADITQRVPATLGVIQSLQGQYGGYFTDVMAQLSGKDDAKYLAHLVPVADLDIRRPEQLSAAQYMLDGIIGDLGGSDDKIYTAAGIIKKSDREEFDARINERSSGFLNTLPYGIRQNYEKTISRGVLAAMTKGGMSEENAAALIAGAFDDTFMYSGKTLIRRSLVEAANINDSGQQIIQGELETEEIMGAFSRMTNRHLPANAIGRQAEYEWVSDGGNGFNMVYINGANQAAFVPDENGQPCKATYSDIINEMREGRIDAIQRDMDGYNGTFENWMVEHKDQQSDLARVAYDRHDAKRSEAREEVARKSTPEYKAKQKELKESAERNRLADRIIGSYSDEQLVTIYNDSMSRDEMMASLGLGSRQGRRLAWTTDEFQEFFFNERLPKAVEAAQGRIDEGKQRRAQAEEQAAKDRAVRVDNAWKLVQGNEALLNNIERDLGDLTIENNDDITYAKAVIRQWLDMFYPVGSWGDSENILPYYNEMTDKLLKKYIE